MPRQNKGSNLNWKLEAPSGFEPEMEVLQSEQALRIPNDFAIFLENSQVEMHRMAPNSTESYRSGDDVVLTDRSRIRKVSI